ncbi:MAG: hypothetical protein K2K48_01350 [Anaeroplasmataceae bacterium]|nr:hypothetical protein [Anaeroplasmataceae bacterium]
MASLQALIKILLVLYLGIFSYILYQIIFYRQKRLLFIKTVLYFGFLSGLIIYVSNQYDIPIFHIYILFYLLGLYLAKLAFSKLILKRNIEINTLLKPLKKWIYKVFKIISIPPFIYWIKEKMRLRKYYKRHPNEKPKTIYELF